MFIAKKKRRENIAEYILYLWQLEDVLRALEFSPDWIYQTLVEPNGELNEEEKQQAFFWYMDMVNLLKTEGKAQRGHMDHTLHLIADLEDLHRHLLQAPVGREKGYVELFGKLAPELPKLKGGGNPEESGALEKSGDSIGSGKEMSDMEAAFRALYSVMLCRMKQQQGGEQSVSESYINDVMELVSPVVALLAAIHGAGERGEIDLYKDMG